MDKLLATAILCSGTAHIFGPGMNPRADFFKKNGEGDERVEKPSSSNGEKETTEKKQASKRVVAFAPVFDGIYLFETIVLH